MDVMVDIEALANTSNSAISQIGAVIFDRYTGKIIDKIKRNVDVQSSVDLGMEMNVETVEWWLNQSKEAQNSILEKPRVSIEQALIELSLFIMDNWANVHNNGVKFINTVGSHTNLESLYRKEDVIIWCHATYDEPNLENAYMKAGMNMPWHYRSVRDLRTLVDLAGYDVHSNERNGIFHDSIDDCLFQIEYAVKCINKLK